MTAADGFFARTESKQALRGSVEWPWMLVGRGVRGVVLDVIIIMALGNVVNAGMLDIMAWLVAPRLRQHYSAKAFFLYSSERRYSGKEILLLGLKGSYSVISVLFVSEISDTSCDKTAGVGTECKVVRP